LQLDSAVLVPDLHLLMLMQTERLAGYEELVTSGEQVLSQLKADMLRMYQEGAEKGEVIYVSHEPHQQACSVFHAKKGSLQVEQLAKGKNMGYFFVDMHIISDFKCHRALTGCDRNTKDWPCTFCKCHGTDTVNITKVHPRREVDVNPSPGQPLTRPPIFKIARHKFHACGMHCHHRMVERLVYEAMLALFNRSTTARSKSATAALQAQKEVDQAMFMQLLNDKNVQGGHCAWIWDDKKNKLKRLSLNGPECLEILKLATELAAVVFPNDTAKQSTMVAVWTGWSGVHADLTAWHLDQDTIQEAIRRGKKFCEAFKDFYGETAKRFPDYVHLMYQHADWFYGLDEHGVLIGPPAWWSTTGLEKSHSLHKRKLRYKTMHGMRLRVYDHDGKAKEISHMPSIYQLFQWRLRMYAWRWQDKLNSRKAKVYRVHVSDLVNLFKAFEFGTSAEQPLTEKEMGYLLSLPDGCAVHLDGYGDMPADLPVHVSVTLANQAAIDKIMQYNVGNGSGGTLNNSVLGRVANRHHAVFLRDPAAVSREQQHRFKQTVAKVERRCEREDLDLSFLPPAST
jgi:hypothetical protein